MANPLPLYALPGEDLIRTATLAMSNEDSDFPAENAQDDDPSLVAKSTTTTTTFTITTPSATPVAVILINTNAETATFEGSGITIPAVDYDGQRVHPWKDLRTAPSTDTSWSLALSKASGVVWVGRILLVTALHDLNAQYGFQRGRTRPGDITITTRGGSTIRHSFDIRTRWASAVVDLVDDMASLMALEANSRGQYAPFLFIPDEAQNDAWFVTLDTKNFSVTVPNIDVRTIPLRFEELSSGPPNG